MSAGRSTHAEGVYVDWQQLYGDNVARIYRLMRARVANPADAEDLTAEVFAAVVRPLQLPVTVSEARAYLIATARTVLAAFWRKRLGGVRTESLVEDMLPPGLCGREQPGDRDAGGRVTAILGRLTDRSRRILELRFLHGYSLQEAAAEMDVTVANAKVLQHRALRDAARLGLPAG